MWVFILPESPTASGQLVNTEGTGKSFAARSGPYGKGALPSGRYTLGKPTRLEDDERNEPYTDPNGNAWWVPLKPQFQTERKGFGFHPDGNGPGSRGCVVIARNDTLSAYELMKEGDELLVVA